MEFVTFEDTSAIYEATFFSQAYRRLWHLLAPNQLFLIEGVVDRDFGAVTLNVSQLKRLDLNRKSCYAENHACGQSEKIGSRFSTGESHTKEFA